MKNLVVKIASSPIDDVERCAQALAVASTAVTSGAQVSLWLSGDAVRLATPGFAEDLHLEQSPELATLRDLVLDGGEVFACTQCLTRRGLVQSDLIEGVTIAGAPSFVEQALAEDAQALVY